MQTQETGARAGQPWLDGDAPPGLRWHVEPEGAGGRCVVGLIGELDAATAPDLQELLEDLLLRRHATEIVIDLTALSFLDSSGLKVFLRTARLAVVSLKLRNPDASTRRVLELMGVEHLLE